MTEEAKDRLKEFRAQYSSAPKSNNKLVIMQIILMIVGFCIVSVLLVQGTSNNGEEVSVVSPDGGLAVEKQREYALHLANRKHFSAAINAYEEYLDKAMLDGSSRAKVCYSVAKLAIDSEDYSKGLAYLYQAEYLDPESDLKEEIDKKVVLCLDKLGRTVDLRKELRKRSSVKRTAADVGPDEVVLAEFGDDIITDRDLELEIIKMPAYMRNSVDTTEKKTELLKNLVAQRLLIDKARRLELDKTPEIQNMLAEQLDSMIVQKLITDEVQSKVNITPEDVERYYKAEKEQFMDPAKADVQFADAVDEEAAKALADFPEKTVTVAEGSGYLQGIAQSDEAVEVIFKTTVDAVTPPVQINEKWYVFKVISKTARKLRPFEEVKEMASQKLQMQKQQEQLQLLIEDTLKARNVKLYPERLNKQEAAETI